MRKGAEQIVETAFRFDMGLDKLRCPDGHEAGRKWFPSLVDRLHLGAVIAKCGVFCAQVEALVKNLRHPEQTIYWKAEKLWQRKASNWWSATTATWAFNCLADRSTSRH